MLTTVGLMETESTVVAMQRMSMTFRNFEELDYVLESIRPQMEQDFRKDDAGAVRSPAGAGDCGQSGAQATCLDRPRPLQQAKYANT